MTIESNTEILIKKPMHGPVGGVSECPSLDWVDSVWSPSRTANPVGSDVAVEPLQAYGGPPGGYGGPPGGGPGGPPGGYGGPPGGYGGPPGGYGGPPGGPPGGYGGPPGYGGPGGYGPQPGYGQPGANPYGAPGAFGAAPMMGPMNPMMGGGLGQRPPRRNAALVLWLTIAPFIALFVLGALAAALREPALLGLVNLVQLASLVAFVFHIMACVDLKNVSNDPSFNWWFIFIPCLNMYALWVMIPEKVNQVKMMAGCPIPRRSLLAYIFLPAYALISDMNDLAG